MVASIVALVCYCYMGYMRQSAEAVFAVFPLLAVAITPKLGKVVDNKAVYVGTVNVSVKNSNGISYPVSVNVNTTFTAK